MLNKIYGKYKKALDVINIVCASYVIFWTLAPIAIDVPILKIFILICGAFWLLTAIIISKSFLLNTKIIVLITYFLIGYIALSTYFSLGPYGFSTQIRMMIYLYYTLFYVFYSKYLLGSLKILFTFTLVVIAVFGTITFIAHLDFVTVSRYITHGDPGFEKLLARGIGAYNLIFTVAMMLPLLLYYLLKADWKYPLLKFKRKIGEISKKEKSISVAVQSALIMLFVLLCMLIGIAKFTYATMTVFICFTVIFMSYLKRKTNIIIIVSILSAFLVAAILIVFDLIVVPKEYASYLSKFSFLIKSIVSGQPLGPVAHKLSLYGQSVRMMFRYPLGGLVYIPESIAGGHSYVLDTLATFGIIIGLLINFISLRIPLIDIKKGKEYRVLAISLSVAVLLVLGLDSLPYGCGVVMFVGFPFIKELRGAKGEDKTT